MIMCDRVNPRAAEHFKAIEAPRLQNTIIPEKEKVKPNEKRKDRYVSGSNAPTEAKNNTAEHRDVVMCLPRTVHVALRRTY